MGFALLYQSFSVVTAMYFRRRLATAYAIGRSIRDGFDFCTGPFHAGAVGPVRLARYHIIEIVGRIHECLSPELSVFHRGIANPRRFNAEPGGLWDAVAAH